MTLINNAQLLLKLEILDKFKLVTNQWFKHKGNCSISSLHQYRRNGNSHDLETLSVDATTLATLRANIFTFGNA